MKDLLIVVAVWNITVFFMYGADKLKAKNGSWRISEQTLILSAFLFGGIGAMLGMFLLRHKTRHLKFRILLPLALIVNIFLLYEAYSRVFAFTF